MFQLLSTEFPVRKGVMITERIAIRKRSHLSFFTHIHIHCEGGGGEGCHIVPEG